MDWVLKVTLWVEFLLYARPLQADHDTYIVMENLREFLGDFNSSQALFAGSLYICRLSAGIHHLKNITYAFVRSEVADCKEDGIEDKNEVLQIDIKHRFIFASQIFMTGGAGYVLSKEAVRRFAFGNSSAVCR